MIKSEVGFSVNNFGKVDVLPYKESVVQVLKNILFLRPGQLPSMPFIGVDITSKVNHVIDNQQLEELTESIVSQCHEILPNIDLSGITIHSFMFNNKPTILIFAPISIGTESESLYMALKQDTQGRVLFNYEFSESII